MSWRAVPSGTEVDLVGPVGDTLEIVITSSDDAYNWSGWTWSGQVRATADAASTVGTFTFTDTSSATALNLTAVVAATTTDDWTAGDTLVYAIQGTKSASKVTFLEGKVIPKAQIVR
jgi:hypothetical protein